MSEKTPDGIGLSDEQRRVAITDPKHLRRWVQAEAPWITFRSADMVDGLPWPDGHQAFQHFVQSYRSQRITIDDPEQVVRRGQDPITKERLELPGCKHDLLTIDEVAAMTSWWANKAGEIAQRKLMAETETQKKLRNSEGLERLREANQQAVEAAAAVRDTAEELRGALMRLHAIVCAVMRTLDD